MIHTEKIRVCVQLTLNGRKAQKICCLFLPYTYYSYSYSYSYVSYVAGLVKAYLQREILRSRWYSVVLSEFGVKNKGFYSKKLI